MECSFPQSCYNIIVGEQILTIAVGAMQDSEVSVLLLSQAAVAFEQGYAYLVYNKMP